jgi:hypothetical protein
MYERPPNVQQQQQQMHGMPAAPEHQFSLLIALPAQEQPYCRVRYHDNTLAYRLAATHKLE